MLKKISQILKEDVNNTSDAFDIIIVYVIKEIEKWNKSRKTELDFDDLIDGIFANLGFKKNKVNLEIITDHLLSSMDEDEMLPADKGFIEDLYELLESLTESKFTIKRRYTELHPSKLVYTNTKIKTKVLERIGLNKIKIEDFNKILQELNANKFWLNKNSYLFKINEDSIELSKYGKRLLNVLKVSDVSEEHSGTESDYADIEKIFDHLIDKLKQSGFEAGYKSKSEIEKIADSLLKLKMKYMSIKIDEDIKTILI